VIVRVLGSAAGGGVPQWNCACKNCLAARSGRAPSRSQSSVAISSDGKRWVLLNCSPDVAAQIEAFLPLQPRERRGTPIAGMLFTDANVDHLGGLASLRQHGPKGFVVRSSEVVRTIALAQPAFAPFAVSPHRWLEAPLGEWCENAGAHDPVGDGLEVRAFALPGTTPGFDGRRSVKGAVVAYQISEPSRTASLVFAPVFSALDEMLVEAVASAEVAFLDGSFYSDDELESQDLMRKHARALGHQPVGGPDGTLAQLRGVRTRVIFTHVNNSNPMLDPSSDAYASVRESGSEIAYDGMELTL
jgi:pyrroloquinoline quinone biosynthesis protein B